jgi:hypothetical protein
MNVEKLKIYHCTAENGYYFDKCLPMGASISCALFETFSSVLHWYVQEESKNKNIKAEMLI